MVILHDAVVRGRRGGALAVLGEMVAVLKLVAAGPGAAGAVVARLGAFAAASLGGAAADVPEERPHGGKTSTHDADAGLGKGEHAGVDVVHFDDSQ